MFPTGFKIHKRLEPNLHFTHDHIISPGVEDALKQFDRTIEAQQPVDIAQYMHLGQVHVFVC